LPSLINLASTSNPRSIGRIMPLRLYVANVIPVFSAEWSSPCTDRREPAAILVGVGDDHRAELADIAEALVRFAASRALLSEGSRIEIRSR